MTLQTALAVLSQRLQVHRTATTAFAHADMDVEAFDRVRAFLDGIFALPDDPARPHIVGGKFQSDKYPTCPAGKVPLSVTDPTAQDLLWVYAHRRRAVDPQFADDLQACLKAAGFTVETDIMRMGIVGVLKRALVIAEDTVGGYRDNSTLAAEIRLALVAFEAAVP